MNIACQSGCDVVPQNVIFGRVNTETCINSAMSNTNCYASNGLQLVETACYLQNSCSIPATSSYFGIDPCPGTYKYLFIQYTCEGCYETRVYLKIIKLSSKIVILDPSLVPSTVPSTVSSAVSTISTTTTTTTYMPCSTSG